MFILKRGLFSILVQNSPKVTKKVLVFRKVARSCSLTKKLLKIVKVAEQNLERPNLKNILSYSFDCAINEKCCSVN